MSEVCERSGGDRQHLTRRLDQCHRVGYVLVVAPLPPLIGIRLASTARSPTSSGPLDPNYGGETGLQGLLPSALNTHRFFSDPLASQKFPRILGGEGGLKSAIHS